MPIIPISDEEVDLWSKPWKNMLIVKVMGKRVNFKFLEQQIQIPWQLKGSIKIMDMADDFHLGRLSSPEDYRFSLFEGPWKVMDHYLIVQRWRLFFSFNTDLIRKIAV